MAITDSFGIYSDEHFMRQALLLAEQAFEEDEVPIGAIVVCKNRIIGRGYNQVEKLCDATAHAEMLAITAASDYLGSKYLDECSLFVTVEPCTMCAGALRWVRMDRIVFGAPEPKFGFTNFNTSIIHPKTECIGGVMEEECSGIMKAFFEKKR